MGKDTEQTGQVCPGKERAAMTVWYGLKPGYQVKTKVDKVQRSGLVIKEYPYFVLVQLSNYKISINKASVYCGTEEIKKRP